MYLPEPLDNISAISEIIVSYCLYISDKGKNHRTHKLFAGRVKRLIQLIENKPLDSFEIICYGACYSRSEDFELLSKTLTECFKLGQPYANNIY